MFRVTGRARKSCVPGITFIAGCLCTLVLINPFRLGSQQVVVEEKEKEEAEKWRKEIFNYEGLEPSSPEQPAALPPLNETLPRAKFGTNWTEDARLEDVRNYGLIEKIPANFDLNQLTLAQLNIMLHSYLDNANFRCHRKLRMGLIGNNGWEICDDIEWRPAKPCVIYSFGINYDFSFDDDAGRIYGCDVYSFDPSMDKQPTYRRSDRVMFYRLGIGGHSGNPIKRKDGWVMHSFSNFRRMLNHSDRIIDVVKMDVERSEWPTLETMIQEGQLQHVRQLLVEYHIYVQHPTGIRKRLHLLRSLEEIGFRKFYITKNGDGGCPRDVHGFPVRRTKCYEVHYVNVNLKRKTG